MRRSIAKARMGERQYEEFKDEAIQYVFNAIVGEKPDQNLLYWATATANPPKGCRFHTRCPYAGGICRRITFTGCVSEGNIVQYG